MKKQFTLLAALLGIGTAVNAQTASLQIIHNCADAAAATVDIYAGNTLLANDLSFRNATTTFTNIPAGTNIVVGVAPGTSTSSSQAIATFSVNFAANTRNIVVANGIVSPTGYTPSSSTRPFTLSTFTAGLAAAPNATTTSLLVHHGSTDAPTVDVIAPFTGSVPVLPNILVNNASYGAFAGYLNLPTANYKIQVRDQNSENVVAEYSAPLQTLGVGGAALTVIASGFLTPANNSNGPAFGLYVATAAGGSLIPLPTSTISSTRLQAIHNCADLAASQVDVYFQSAATGPVFRLLDNFAFRTASPYIDVPVGQTVSLSIAPSTSTSSAQAIATLTYNLSATNKYQLIASGILSPTGYNPSAMMAPFNLIANANVRERSLNANNTDVLVFHGATDAPTVGVSAQGVGPVVSNLAYSQFNSTGYLPLASNTPAGNYTLHLTNAANTVTLASYNAPLNTLGTTGLGITVLASGFLTPANNSNGPAFGLWAALPAGGNLVQLPVLSGLSIKETKLNQFISMYPNPATDNLFITNTSANKGSVKLFDLTGKMLLSQNIDENLNTLNINSLATGVYLVEVTIGNDRVTQKLVK
jgi:hypothetical protein